MPLSKMLVASYFTWWKMTLIHIQQCKYVIAHTWHHLCVEMAGYSSQMLCCMCYLPVLPGEDLGFSGGEANTEGHDIYFWLQHTIYSTLQPSQEKLLEECNISVRSTLACKACHTKGVWVHTPRKFLKIATESESIFSTLLLDWYSSMSTIIFYICSL